MATKVLKDELAVYEKQRKRLEKEHLNKFVLIYGKEIIGTFDTFQNAADEGLRRFGDGPFLIRPKQRLGCDRPGVCLEWVWSTCTIPASMDVDTLESSGRLASKSLSSRPELPSN